MRFRSILVLIISLIAGIAIGYAVQENGGTKSVRFMQSLYDQTLRIIQKYYVDEEDPALLIEESIKGMLKALDPYSEFLTPEDFESFKTHTSGVYGGVGMQVMQQDGRVVVTGVFDGSPAQRAGLLPGDIIVKVDGEDVTSWDVNDVVNKIKGEPGTRVKITVVRPGVDELLTFEVTREIIKIPLVPYYTLVDGDIGYVRLSQFSTGSASQLKEKIEELKGQGAKKFVLDLRGNPGGILYEAVQVSNIFLDKGNMIVLVRGRGPDSDEYYRAEDEPELEFEVPVVVLVDYGSASASEIVAGALQDWDRAILIGDTTYGKGSVQRLIPLEGNYAIKLTVARYYTPSGRSIDRTTTTLKERKEKKDKKEHLVFFTKRLGRKVYSGGGIVPDIVMQYDKEPVVVQKLIADGLFWAFASDYKASHDSPPETIDDKLFEDFVQYVLGSDKAKDDRYRKGELELYSDNIKKFLDIYISEIFDGTKGRYRASLKYDKMFQKARDFLSGVNSTDEAFEKLEAGR